MPCLQASASGMYIVEKIDLLVGYLIAVPLAKWLSQYFPQVELPRTPLLSSTNSGLTCFASRLGCNRVHRECCLE